MGEEPRIKTLLFAWQPPPETSTSQLAIEFVVALVGGGSWKTKPNKLSICMHGCRLDTLYYFLRFATSTPLEQRKVTEMQIDSFVIID